MPPNTFTEDEVNQMLANQEIKLRITGVEKAVTTLTKNMVEHMTKEEREMDQIMEAIEKVGKERRESETSVREDMRKMHNYNNDTFIKKSELKLYVSLIIASILASFGSLAWFIKYLQ
jgi:N-glycosylase/DNA lyase